MPHPRPFAQSPLPTPMVAVLLLALVAGCSAQRELAGYPAATSAAAADAPWPRLVDGPTHARPPGPGPDPATGAFVVTDLGAAARSQAETARRLAGPVQPTDDLLRDADAVRAAAR